MALDYAINTDLRLPVEEEPGVSSGPTVNRALAIYSEALLAASSTDADASLPVDTSRVHGATLVRLAEAAVDYGEFQQAHNAISAFEREDPPKDQYYIRALFVHAALKSWEAKKLSGAFKLGLVREAIGHILQGLAIATDGGVTGDPRAYAFLVYNASVHHWVAVRPLLRTGARQYAIPSLNRVLECLTKVEDPDTRWRARHCLALATCYAEAGDLTKAAALAGQAQDLLGPLEPAPAGSSDAALCEEALRLRLHYSALLEPQAAADGGLDAKLAAAVKPNSKTDSAGQPNARPDIWLKLQPILSASAPGYLPSTSAALGYAHAIGVDKSNLAAASGGPANAPKRTATTNPAALRTKLVDMLKQLRPAAASDYDWMKSESESGKLNPDMPDFRAVQKAKEAQARKTAAQAGTAAGASGSDEEPLAVVSAKRAKDLDLVALIAQAAIQHGCIDVAYACVRALAADKSTSPAAAILADVVDAQLLVAGMTPEDAHFSLGHFVEIPSDTLNAYSTWLKLQAHNAPPSPAAAGPPPGTAASTAKGGKPPAAAATESKEESKHDAPAPKQMRTRRQSLALQASISFWPKRTSEGKAVMLPHTIPANTPFPELSMEHVEALLQHRRLQACKLLKRAMGNARMLKDSLLIEICATLAWNLSLPLLKDATRKAVHGTLSAAATALHDIDSGLVALRVRLHLECSRLERSMDMLAAAATSAARALALDYGGLRLDPAYAHSAPDRAALLPMPPLPDGTTGTAPASADVRVLSTQRPLDRHIIPAARAAALKGSVYDDPEGPADAAFIAIEQAKAATDAGAAVQFVLKACAALDEAAGSTPAQAHAYKRHRSPSVFTISMDTAAVVSLPQPPAAADAAVVAAAATPAKPASRPATPKRTPSRPTSAAQTSQAAAAAPASAEASAAAAKYPAGEAGGALTVQLHKLWLELAEVAARIGAFDAVVRACHVLRGVVWNPLQSRDMLLGQAKADLLLADASAAQARGFGQTTGTVELAPEGWEEDAEVACEDAIEQQQRRANVAAMLLSSGRKVSSLSCAPQSSAVADATGIDDKAADKADGPNPRWWETPEVPEDKDASKEGGASEAGNPSGGPPVPPAEPSGGASDPSNSFSADAVLAKPKRVESVIETAVEGRLVDGTGLLASAEPTGQTAVQPDDVPRGPPRQHMPTHNGHAPGFKPIPTDPRAMGVIVPGCPAPLLGLKVRAITSLSRAARRAVALKATWLVETAAMKLWNAHLHVWQANEYGYAVMPQLTTAVADMLNCLAAVGSTKGELLSKLANVLCRSHEEAARIAAVDEALGIKAADHPYYSIAGAVLLDLEPGDPPAPGDGEDEDPTNTKDALAKLGGAEEDYTALLASLTSPTTHGKPWAALADLASFMAGLVLTLPPSVLRPTSRRSLIQLRARVRLMTSHGLGIAGLLQGLPTGTVPGGPVVDAVTNGQEADSEGSKCPETARALALLVAQHHPGVTFQERVLALKAAVASIEKAPAELDAVLALITGPPPSADRPGTTAGKTPGKADAKAAPPAAAAPSAGKPASAGAIRSTIGSPLQFDGNTWGKGDQSVPGVYGLTAESEAEWAVAVGQRPSEAEVKARTETARREHTALLAELWAKAAQAAANLSELSADPAVVSPPKPGAAAAAAPSAGAPAPDAGPAVIGEPDAALLIEAQRCAAMSIALVPNAPIRLDEMGSLFGVRGHGYDYYGLPMGSHVAKVLAPTQDTIDVSVGRVSFTHRFSTGPDASIIEGAGKGGMASAFKWWAVAEISWSKAVAMLINQQRQGRAEQDLLRRAALDHATSAASWASHIRDAPLVHAACMQGWNVGLPLALSSITRPQLQVPIESLLQSMSAAGPGATTHDALLLKSELYRTLLGCHADLSHWNDGLRVAEEAFQSVPASYHDRLWGPRLLFQSKLGQDCTTALEQLRSRSPVLQARLWVSLARLASLPVDQATAYHGALSLLNGMFTRAFVLADYAEWLAANHFPVQDVRDALLTSVDIILSVDQASNATAAGGADAEGGAGDGGQSVARSSMIRGSVAGGAGMKSVAPGNARGSIVGGSVTGGRSSALGPAYSRPPPTMVGGGTMMMTKGGAGKSQATGTGTKIGQAQEQPEEVSDWPLALDVGHLDLLVRIFCQLSLTAESGSERVSYALTACHFVTRMLESSAQTANLAAAEAAFLKLPPAEAINVRAFYATWLQQQVNEGQHKLPADVGAWAGWWASVCSEVDKPVPGAKAQEAAASGKPPAKATAKPEATAAPAHLSPAQVSAKAYADLRTALSSLPVMYRARAVTKASIRAPPVTLATLSWLTETLVRSGYAAAAAPVLAAQHLIASDVLDSHPPCTPAITAAVCASAVWADACNQRPAAAALFKQLTPQLTLTETDRRTFEAEVILREAAAQHASNLGGEDASNSSLAGNFTSAMAAKRFKAALKGGNVIAGVPGIHRMVLSGPMVHRAWLSMARLAADMGLAKGARLLLLESRRHASVHRDYESLWECDVIEARVASLEGNGRVTVDLCLSSAKEATSASVAAWMDVVQLLVTTLQRHHKHSDARVVLQAALAAVDQAVFPSTVQVPTLTDQQMGELQRKTDASANAAAKEQTRQRHQLQSKGRGSVAVEAKPVDVAGSVAHLVSAMPRPQHGAPTGPDVDALQAAISIRILLAQVHAKDAVRARRVGAPWMPDWVSADALFAEAASLARKHGLDADSPLLARTLHAHGCAILLAPGFAPDQYPPNPAVDGEYASVGGGEDMAARFRASPPARRARLLYLGLACKLLREANDAVGAWANSTDVPGVPADWLSPASRLAGVIRQDLAKASLLCMEEEVSASLAAEKSMLTGVGADPVTLYLLRAEADGSAKALVSLSQAGPSRAALAVEAISAALSTIPVGVVRHHAVASVAYACALHGLLLSEASSTPFDLDPTATQASGGLGLMAQRGVQELLKVLWDLPGAKVKAPALADIKPAAAAPAAAAPAAAPAGKGAPAAKPASASRSKGGAAVPAPAGASTASWDSLVPTEVMPLPAVPEATAVGGAVDAVAGVAVCPVLQPLPTAVPAPLRTLHKRAVTHLQQSIAVAAAAGQWDAVGSAAASLVEGLGCLAPTRAALALALHQSCTAIHELRQTFAYAAGEANKQVVHMRLVEDFESQWLQPELQAVYGAAQQYLATQSLAHRLLNPGKPVEDVFSLLPTGVRVLILQRSPSGRVLYAGVLTKVPTGATASTAAASDASFAPLPGLVGRVWRHELSDGERGELGAVCMASRSFRTDYLQLIRKQGEAAGAVSDLHPTSAEAILAAAAAAAEAARGLDAPSPAPAPAPSGSRPPSRPASAAVVPAAPAPAAPVPGCPIVDGLPSNLQDLLANAAQDAAEARADAIVERMAALLAPVLSASAAGPWVEGELPVVVLADKSLACLPLEALPCLASAKAVTRDFSMSFLGHRLAVSAAMKTLDKPGSASASNAGKPWYSVDGPQPCHASLASTFAVADPLLEDLPRGQAAVDEPAALTAASEAAESGAPRRLTAIETVETLQSSGQTGTPAAAPAPAPAPAEGVGEVRLPTPPPPPPKPVSLLGLLASPAVAELMPETRGEAGPTPLAAAWTTLRGDKTVPSSAAVQQLLRTAPVRASPEEAGSLVGGAMVYHGPGRLLEHMEPALLAGLLAPGVRLVLLADFAGTERSARRNAMEENGKKAVEGRMDLEHSWETAALLSLSGVGTVVAPAWPVSATAAQALMVGTLHGAARQGMTVAEAVRAVFTPAPAPEAPAAPARSDAEAAATGVVEPAPTPRALVRVKTRVRYAAVVYGLPHLKVLNA